MNLKEFKDWCECRACDGCWDLSTALLCINIIKQIQIQPLWRRKGKWLELNSKYPINDIIAANNRHYQM